MFYIIIVGILIIFISTIVLTYILIDMIRDKYYKDEFIVFLSVLACTSIEWIGTILIIKELIV